MLQGLGKEDWFEFKMDELTPQLAQSFVGNALLGSRLRWRLDL